MKIKIPAKNFLSCISTLLVFFFASCIQKPVANNWLINEPPIDLHLKSDFNFNDIEALKQKLASLEPLSKEEKRAHLVKILIAFSSLTKNIKNGDLEFLPYTKTKIELSSFCASSRKAVPDSNEIFEWVSNPLEIPLLKELLRFDSKTNHKYSTEIQEILWNLENKTYYENYPENLKNIINEVSASARITLPSRVKSQISYEVIPNEVLKSVEFIEGGFSSFDEIKQALEKRASKASLPEMHFASKIPNTDILASTKSNGYESQIITFYNPTNKSVRINVGEYHLRSSRSDVQPVIIASTAPHINESQRLLEAAALKLLGYFASKYPSLNASEKRLAKERPIDAAIVFYNATIAEQNADRFFPKSSRNGEGDAFRHFVWSALITRDLGEKSAQDFLNAHELSPNQAAAEKNMDEFNNTLGIKIAAELGKQGNFENQELFDRALEDIKLGKLKTLGNAK